MAPCPTESAGLSFAGTTIASPIAKNVRLGFRSARCADGWSERGSPRATTRPDTRRDKSPGDRLREHERPGPIFLHGWSRISAILLAVSICIQPQETARRETKAL